MDDFERLLRTEVTRRGDELEPSPDLPERIHARVAQRRRQQRLRTGALTGVGATVAVVAVVVGLFVVRPADTDQTETAGRDDRTTTTQSTQSAQSPDRESTTTTDTGTDGASPAPDSTDPAAGDGDTDAGDNGDSGGTGGSAEGPGTTDSPGPGEPTETTSPPTSGPQPTITDAPVDRKPPDSEQPAAGVCAPASGAVVEITLHPDVPAPRCAQVGPDQSLRIRNSSDQQVEVSLAYHAATLAPGAAQSFTQPFGEYLEPGVHRVSVSPLYGGSGPEIWLVP
jgi:hypothetical protein